MLEKLDMLCESMKNNTIDKKEVIKQSVDENTKMMVWNCFFNTMMVEILDLCQNVRTWARQGENYRGIAKDFITDIFMNYGNEIAAYLFENVVNEEQYQNLDENEKNEAMKKAIINGGWLFYINKEADGYANAYVYPEDDEIKTI